MAADVEEAFLAEARELAARHPNLDPVATTSPPGLKPPSFDLVLCSEVIEHLPDSRPALPALRDCSTRGTAGPLHAAAPQPPRARRPDRVPPRCDPAGARRLPRADPPHRAREPPAPAQARAQLGRRDCEVLYSGHRRRPPAGAELGEVLPCVSNGGSSDGCRQAPERVVVDRVLPGRRLTAPTVSLVVPVFDEERRLPFLLGALAPAWETGSCSRSWSWTTGSADRTPAILREAAERDPPLMPLITGGPNEGKGAALPPAGAAPAAISPSCATWTCPRRFPSSRCSGSAVRGRGRGHGSAT